MRKNVQRFFQTLLPGQLDFKERINRMVMLLVFVSSVIGIVLVLLGADKKVLCALLPICAISGLSIRITLVKGHSRAAAWLLAIGTNVFFFPLLFITSGGTQSGMPVWFVLGLVYIFLLFEGRSFAIAITLSVLSFFGTYLLTYYCPRLVPASTRFYSFSDSFIALLCVSCFIGIVLKIQARTYEQEKKIAEQQKREMEIIARSKDTFFANMSHEIRTPMNAIVGLSDIIMEESKGRKVYDYACDIKSASKNLLALINDILDLSKVEAGKMELVSNEYHIKAIVDEVINMMEGAASKKGILLKCEFDMSIPSRYRGDDNRIRQILINLLNNGLKFTKEGYVKLTVSGAPGEKPGTERLHMEIKDTGCGIREEDLEKIFENFSQVDARQNRSVEGTGLGLSISRRLVELMQGNIRVESVYGEGTTFILEIIQEIVDPKSLSEAPSEIVKEEELRLFVADDYHVLIVDDNLVNRKVARGFLRPYGFLIDEAGGGREAVDKVRQTKYDIIFMDHMMPEMDGIEAVQIIRSDCGENGTQPVIIALTANAMEGVREMFLQKGFQDFVTKPLDKKTLNETLLRWIPEQRRKESETWEENVENRRKITTGERKEAGK